ncbi:Flp pilus assembly protein CpaB [Longirhabdus pacifica]|uniref:Flp pilus assembly protein CpaB n=1 Tax=Longirhabdus pacifica TaxID=2305227 RepID=UPI001008A7E1|nr:Flp pilus assembly protein CpaB [Longirhabdus pacifica]
MKKKWIIIVVAIAIGMIGTLLIYIENTKRLHEIDIYVAKVDIPENTKITKEMVTKEKKKSHYLMDGTLVDDAMIGQYTTVPIYQHESFLKVKLHDGRVNKSVGYDVKEGERIVSITVDNAESIGGVVKAGQFVDLIWVHETQDQLKVAKPLYQHVEVLDLRTKTGLSESKEGSESGIQFINTNATAEREYPLELVLRVSQEQSVAISLAEESGKVKVVLDPSSIAGAASYSIEAIDTIDLSGGERNEANRDVSNGGASDR